jgi:DNA polymerase-3 subunit delta'
MLLTGEDGAGTLAIAIAFARVVNCEQPVVSGDRIDACGTCHACKQNHSLQHPNVRFVISYPSGKAETDDELPKEVVEELKEAIQTVAADPYVPFQLTNATQIRIGQIRDLKRSLALSSAQNGRRVVIIHHADEMKVESANAFLKTLEEPHENVTLILTTAHPERLLQTIVSRCQEVVVPPLDDDQIISALVSGGWCTHDEAVLLAPFAEGDVMVARSFIGEDVRADREEAVNLLRSALKGREYRSAISAAASAIGDGRDRQRARMLLTLLALWLRDAAMIAAAGTDAPITNADMRDAVVRFAQSFGQADLMSALRVIEQAVRDIRANVTINLVVTTAMMEIRTILLTSMRTATSGAA